MSPSQKGGNDESHLTCPCRGCSNDRQAGDEMCGDCWAHVPEHVRATLERTRRKYGPWSDGACDARERAFVFAETELEQLKA